jgi:hypothetical protein
MTTEPTATARVGLRCMSGNFMHVLYVRAAPYAQWVFAPAGRGLARMYCVAKPMPAALGLEHFTLACVRRPACGLAWLRQAASTTQQVGCFAFLARLVLGNGRLRHIQA